jgi:hypothetical protein
MLLDRELPGRAAGIGQRLRGVEPGVYVWAARVHVRSDGVELLLIVSRV